MKCTCVKCGYSWESLKPSPKCCAGCGSKYWRVPFVTKFQALKSLISSPGDDCIPWPYGKAGNGYGSVQFGYYKKDYAHRVSYLITCGNIPEGLHVLHKCDNPPCINPRHLFLGTEKDNRADQIKKGRTCIGEKNGFSKLTESQVLQIRRLYKKGVVGRGQIAIGKLFGVHRINIRKIVNRITWRHI